MLKARSRLIKPVPEEKPQPPRHHGVVATTPSSDRFKRYLRHSPLLIPASLSFSAVWYLITHFYPEQLANIPVTGSFLLVLLPFFLGCFFLLSYLLLNTRLALVSAFALTVGLFLRLQQVRF